MSFLKRIAIRLLKFLDPGMGEDTSFVPVVVDLDRMFTDPIGIKFHGKVHKINPMELSVFLKTVNEIARLDALRKKENIPVKEIREGYYKVFSQCSDTLGNAARDMNDIQIAAVLRQIGECVTGKAYAETAQKKNTLIPILSNA